MDASVAFRTGEVNTLALRLRRCSLTIRVMDVEDIQVQILGGSAAAQSFRHTLSEGRLVIRQSWRELLRKAAEVIILLPLNWKGALDARTLSGSVDVSGLSGSDLTLSSTAGAIHAEGLTGITITLKTLLGAVDARDLACDHCALRTFTGSVTLAECGFLTCKARTFTGAVSVDLVSSFDTLEAQSFTGGVSVSAPLPRTDASLRSLSGRLLTEGVSIGPNAPRVSLLSATANLQLNCSLNDTAATI